MKIVLLIFLLVTLLFGITSCSRKEPNVRKLVIKDGKIYEKDSAKPFTGREIGKVNNKTITYDVVNGLKSGEFKVLYSNGNPQMIGQIINNKNEGLWKYFYPDSQLESEGKFKNDLPDGKWCWYYNDGSLREKGFFIEGKKQGKWFVYDKNGYVIKEFSFVNDIEKK